MSPETVLVIVLSAFLAMCFLYLAVCLREAKRRC